VGEFGNLEHWNAKLSLSRKPYCQKHMPNNVHTLFTQNKTCTGGGCLHHKYMLSEVNNLKVIRQ